MDSLTSVFERPWTPSMGRSLRLFRAFRYEQCDPARFYRALAEDSVGQVSGYLDLHGKVVLDVGGGPGYFREAFVRAGARYYRVDIDVGELEGCGEVASGAVVGSGMQLPFADEAFDLCYSSNVLEHVPEPWVMADEMLRVTRPGGVVFLSATLWYGPWGGHETAPWHYLGGLRAREHYLRKHGRQPKNKYGESLFPVTVKAATEWGSRQTTAEVLAVLPRYNPRSAYWLTKLPLVREVVTWNLLLVLRKR